MDLQQYIGLTEKFPITLNANGTAATSQGTERLNESILFLLESRIGDSWANPDYGSNLYKLKGTPNSAIFDTLFEVYARQAIERFEPRVRYDRTEFNRPSNKPLTVECTVYYEIIANGEQNTVVFPFYLNG